MRFSHLILLYRSLPICLVAISPKEKAKFLNGKRKQKDDLMGIFDFFKRSYREQVVLEYTIQKNCNVAIGFAERFEKDFDYSKRSLSDLEEILEYYSKDLLRSNPSENQLISMSLIFGSYLGQTLLMQGHSQKAPIGQKTKALPFPF